MNIQDENKAVATRGVAPEAKQLAQGITTDGNNNGAVRKTTGQVINHQPVTPSTPPIRKPVLPNNKKLGGGILANPVKAMKVRRDRNNPMFQKWNTEDEKSFVTGFNGN